MTAPPPLAPGSPPLAPARVLLRDVFGFHEYRPHQEEVVEHLVAGGDAFVLMPTGGGKSLCYQLPALVRPGTGIVVSPLISLMKDQVDALRAAGVSAAAYNSSLECRRSAPGAGATCTPASSTCCTSRPRRS